MVTTILSTQVRWLCTLSCVVKWLYHSVLCGQMVVHSGLCGQYGYTILTTCDSCMVVLPHKCVVYGYTSVLYGQYGIYHSVHTSRMKHNHTVLCGRMVVLSVLCGRNTKASVFVVVWWCFCLCGRMGVHSVCVVVWLQPYVLCGQYGCAFVLCGRMVILLSCVVVWLYFYLVWLYGTPILSCVVVWL